MTAQRIWLVRYIAAVLPALVTVGWWQWAVWAYDDYGCKGGLKNLQPCFAGGVNIIGSLGIGLFWCQALAWVCVPLSLYLLLEVWSRHSGRYRRYRDGKPEPD